MENRLGTKAHSNRKMIQMLDKIREKASKASNIEGKKPLTKE